MRVRMLKDPAVIRLINSETIAVKMNVTHNDLPDLPAFDQHREALRDVVWSHLGFGVWSLIASDGSVAYTSAPSASSPGTVSNSAAQALPQLHAAIGLHSTLQRLLLNADQNASKIEQLLARSTPLAMDLHALTTFFLMGAGDGRWDTIREAITQPSGSRWISVQGAREGVIRALGDLLLYEGTIEPPRWLQWRYTDAQVRQKAASELAYIVGVELPSLEDGQVEFMRVWWREHRDHDTFRVQWASNLPDRNAFMFPSKSQKLTTEPGP